MTETVENAPTKQRGRPFQKGQSGNPAGKPKGTRHKATQAVQVLLDGEAEALTRKAVDMALQGDVTALRLCLERVCPVAKERPLPEGEIQVPKRLTASNAGEVFGQIFKAVSGGRLLPGEGSELVKLMTAYLNAFEYSELAERLDELEQAAPRCKRW